MSCDRFAASQNQEGSARKREPLKTFIQYDLDLMLAQAGNAVMGLQPAAGSKSSQNLSSCLLRSRSERARQALTHSDVAVSVCIGLA